MPTSRTSTSLLLCSGGGETGWGPLRIAELASSRFDYALHVIDDVGHVPHIEQPEAFLRAVRAALPEP